MRFNYDDNQDNNQQRPNKPVNLYIGENFAVRVDSWIKFRNLITNLNKGGIISCDFQLIKAPIDRQSLSSGARKMLSVVNAGGNSINSEAFSYEMLRRCFMARLYQVENEVLYSIYGGKMTDYVCYLFDMKIGVSVTRHMEQHGNYIHKKKKKKKSLLMRKLEGIVQSSRNSHEKWAKQILHVWVPDKHTANIVTDEYNTMDNDVKSNTVVIVTTTEECDFIYKNCKSVFIPANME
ncbi:hypothetical protein ACJMK2_000572 [Sinanodonta woodiana]|uniref:Uncharacterized protein n=1 Tax=Sinanodonta woodiana TaxID=1069815 RepID=A0ABD3XRF6_SINWO